MAVTITRTAWTDDDGSGTVGTVINNAEKTTLYGQIDTALAALPVNGTSLTAHGVLVGNGTSAVAVTAVGTTGQVLRGVTGADPAFGALNLATDVTGVLARANGGTGVNGPVVQTTTSTGTVNDFALTAGASVLRCNNASLLTLTGIAAGFDGQRLVIVSVGAGQVDLSHQDAGSTTVGDRFINFATVGKTSLAAGSGVAEYEYDGTTARWRLVNHEQGAWITRTFAAGNYTATTGTWTVASATRDAFYLKGRTLMFSANAGGTTSGTPVTVKIAIPNSYVSAAVDTAAYYVQGNGAGGSEGGYVTVGAAGTTVNFQRFANTAFAAGTVTVNTVVTFEVQ